MPPLTVVASPKDTIIFGFDSAWVDKTPGAICALSFDACGRASFAPPVLVSFKDALEFINTRKAFARVVVALDQPTIVPNATGMRPAERIAASLLSSTGGGVQPAYRCKANMFGDYAPIWKFKKALAAVDDPQRARSRDSGLFLVEVFPALALPSLHAPFAYPGGAPKYNPKKSTKFKLADWEAVVKATAATAKALGLSACAKWCSAVPTIAKPAKSAQDCLDSTICALIGFIWIACDPSASMVLGDLKSGYIVTPVSAGTRTQLVRAAAQKDVPVL